MRLVRKLMGGVEVWVPAGPGDPPAAAEPPLPSWGRMAAGYASSQVRHLATGRKRASVEAQAARWAACERGEGLTADQIADGHCDHYRPSDKRCGAVDGCGCWLTLKIPQATARCRLGRWPDAVRA
jgi:hypothetical protein